MIRTTIPSLALAATLTACAGDAAESVVAQAAPIATTIPDGCAHPTWCPAPSSDWARDLLDTALSIDVSALRGEATITFVPSTQSTGASFDVRGLIVHGVRGPLGPLQHRVEAGRLDVGVPLGTVSITVDYGFTVQDEFDGLLEQGVTFTWPYFCGNLFPCKPDTDDGQSYALDVTGVPAGQTAVYPSVIPGNAPSYMPAIAYGEYTRRELGTTPAGTKLSVWYLPGGEAAALRGTARLVDGFAFLEHTLGDYTFGDEAGAVAAPWGPGAVGGMEHHPFWHVGTPSMGSALTQLHEAAHGWFGNGVRMRCWEDFVLSEGSANYWAVRAVEAVYGEPSRTNVWNYYRAQLDFPSSSPTAATRSRGQRAATRSTSCTTRCGRASRT
jgi:hypothetical protein